MVFEQFAQRAVYFSKHFGQLPRVLVLYGGETNEREVSIQSGKAVVKGLKEGKAEVIEYEVSSWEELLAELPKLKYDVDVVFNLIHGGKGEDGSLHALLDMLKIPYVGSNQVASALAMHKEYCKFIWSALGLNIPSYCLVSSDRDKCKPKKEDYPLIVKPANEGSSNGITKVTNEAQLNQAVIKALRFSDKVLIEQFIEGREITVSIIDGEAFTPIEIIPVNEVYDYHAKYVANDTQFFCPPKNIPENQFSILYEQAKLAYSSIGARHWGRVDFIVDSQGIPWILEVNLIPGMTSHSLVPQAAAEQGMTFSQLVCGLVSLANYKLEYK
jgi:D-alanine-D-alanine ligase